MFKLDPDYNNRINQRLETVDETDTIKQCYKNRIYLGCTYPKWIEKTLDEMDKLVLEEIPWWVYIID